MAGDPKPPPRKRAPAKKAPAKKAPAAKAAPRAGGKRTAYEAAPEVTDADRAAAAEQISNVVPMKRATPRRSPSASRTRPEALDVHDRRIRAMNLRRLGSTWAQVAEAIRQHPATPAGYDAASAYRDVKAVLDSVTVEAVQDLRNEDLATLNSLMRTAYPRALAGEDPVWMDKVLKILDARAKYTGLYAPQRVALAGPGGGPIAVAAASPEQLYEAAVDALDELLPHVPMPELPGLPAGPGGSA